MSFYHKKQHKHSSHHRSKRKSAFGGHVKSHEEVKALNEKIKEHEQKELEDFEQHFENVKDDLWKE